VIHRLGFLQLVKEHQPLRQRELRQREPVFQLQVQALQQLEPEQVLRQLALILQLQGLHLLLLQLLF
jgi:hypothetical protein